MNFLKDFLFKKLSKNPKAEILAKEAFRKMIHIFAAAVPFAAKYAFYPVVISLSVITLFYCIFEKMRLGGTKISIVSFITNFAARERDMGKFVLGPVTLSLGVILTLLIFKINSASVGIISLALGDGLSGLAGKIWGKRHIFNMKDKTIAGSSVCFTAIFISVFLYTGSFKTGLIIAFFGTIVELLPLKDFDNILIPVVCAGIASFLGIN